MEQSQIDHWRSERLRLLREIADDPTDARKRRSTIEASLVQVESFIRYYEARLEETAKCA